MCNNSIFMSKAILDGIYRKRITRKARIHTEKKFLIGYTGVIGSGRNLRFTNRFEDADPVGIDSTHFPIIYI